MGDSYLTVDSSGVDQDGWIPLAEAAKLSPHGADYLSLLARRGKLAARKINDVWYTTPKNLEEYLTGQRVYREQARERLRALLSSKSPSVGDVAMPPVQAVRVLPQNTFFRTHSFPELSTHRKKIALSTGALFLIGATMIGSVLLASLSNPVFSRVRDFALRAGVPHEEVAVLTRAHENFSNLVASNFGTTLRSLTANVDDAVKTTTASVSRFSWFSSTVAFFQSLFGNQKAEVVKVSPPTSTVTIATSTERVVVERVNTPTTIVKNYPQYTTITGVSSSALAIELQGVKNEILSKLYSAISNVSSGVSANTHAIQLTNRIDQLASVAISGSTWSGGTISGATINGSTISGGSSTFSSLTISSGDTSLATTTISGPLSITSSATTTLANGVNLSGGCFAINSTCITGGGGGSGTVNSGTQGQLAYYAANGTTLSATSTIFLSGTGNIGIGTTSPFSLFSVAGNGFFNGDLTAANVTATGTLSVSGAATLATSLNGPLQANNGAVTATTSIGAVYGGTGLTSYSVGDVLYASSANTLARLGIGSTGQVLKVSGGLPSWGADATGGSGGVGAWATTSNSLAVYPTDTSNVVLIGASATSTTGNIFEVVGNSLFRGLLTAYNTISAPNFTATSTTVASTFPYASTTALTVSGTGGLQLATGLNGPLQANAGLVSATSSIGTLYGGTGLTATPSFGQILRGTGTGYALVATSTLGIALGDTTGTLNIATQASGILSASNGGTGLASVQANTLLLGNGTGAFATTSSGTNGQILSLVGGVPSWVATTTYSSGLTYLNGNVTNTGVLSTIAGTGINVSGATGNVTISNSGLLSLAHTYGTAQTGAITFATTSTAFNGLTANLAITNSSGAFTFAPTLSGTLGVGGGGTGASTFSYGLVLSPGGTAALTNVATSSLGLLTTDVAEGSNLYYTDSRVNAFIHASST
ncbi:MAG: hypothetical protein V4437_02405, partial [Patescibacteria group bacterium]